jgi:hypothetical protein
MKSKATAILIFFNLILLQAFSQLSLNDLVKSTKIDRDSYVEYLMSKGFRVIHTPGYWLGQYGRFFDEVTLSSSKYQGASDFMYVELAHSEKDSDGRVLVQNRSFEFEFNGSTYAVYQKIQSEIKAKYQKVDFFLNLNTDSYVTKYKAGEYFIFVGNLNVWDLNGRKLDKGWIAFQNYSSPYNVPK